MTRIVLLLTAIPLAAVLALVLDTLLDRRLAALRATVRTSPARTGRRGLSIALALGLVGAAGPALAEPPEPACTQLECSLSVEADRVERLWRSASNDRFTLVAQSRIPVAFDPALDSWDAMSSEDVVADDGTDVPAADGAESAVPARRQGS